ncbi:MAG: hypothetical protein GY835_05845 [bacterium]|nr:hypothetical protein [bacterium]
MFRIVILVLSMLLIANLSLGQTTWTKHPSNPILDLGDHGDFDSRHVGMKSVVLHNDLFFLFYHGSDGTSYKIALAISSDAINWSRYGVVLDIGNPGDFDSEHVSQPHVVQIGQEWWMYYEGRDDLSQQQIGLAYSDDLVHWTKSISNPVLHRDPSIPEEAIGVSQPHVLFDGDFRMYYIQWNYDNNIYYFSIGLAYSEDGIVWSKYANNPVLQCAPSPAWDDNFVAAPFIQIDSPTDYSMLYAGGELSTNHCRLGKATSIDGIEWNRSPGNPFMDVGTSGAWDDEWITHPYIVIHADIQYMFYCGLDGDNWRVGLATAPIHEPNICNVLARQLDPPNNQVVISYDLYTPSDEPVEISLFASNDLGVTFDLLVTSVTGDVGSNITPGLSKLIYWDARRDYPGLITDSMRVRVIGITEGK